MRLNLGECRPAANPAGGEPGYTLVLKTDSGHEIVSLWFSNADAANRSREILETAVISIGQ